MGRPGRTPWACGALAALSLIVPVWLLWYPSGGILSFDSPIPQAGRVLLVTAHPDDETIFFSPTISALRYAGNEVFLLCFTNGTCRSTNRVLGRGLSVTCEASDWGSDLRQFPRIGTGPPARAPDCCRSASGANFPLLGAGIARRRTCRPDVREPHNSSIKLTCFAGRCCSRESHRPRKHPRWPPHRLGRA